MRKKYSLRIMGSFAILMIVITSCRMPLKAQETAASTQPAAAETPVMETVIESTPVAESLPPQIVEAEPAPGSTIRIQQQFLLVFNQPMDQASVESGLAVAPSVSFQTNWLDERSLQLTLDAPLPLDSDFSVSIPESIRSAGGLDAGEAIVLEYRTPGPLRLTDVLPEPGQTDVNPGGVVMVSFNQPVVELGESFSDAAAFELAPAAEGKGEWLNTSTYVFYPEPCLAGGLQYTLKLNQGLTSRQGAALELIENQQAEWTFQTRPPELLTVEPTGDVPIDIDTDFIITFNQAMDKESAEEAFSLTDETGEQVAGSFTWSEDSSILTFKPNRMLPRDREFILTAGADAQGSGGTRVGRETVYRYQTVGRLAVQEVSPTLDMPLEIYSGYSSLQIRFNAPLAEADYAELVNFSPALIDPYIYRGGQDTLVLSGYFKGNTNYNLSISGSLSDKWDQGMGRDYRLSFSTSPLQSLFFIPLLNYGAQSLFVTPQDESIQAQAVNIPAVNLAAEEVTLDQYIDLSSDSQNFQDAAFSGEAIFWQQNLSLPADSSQTVEIYLDENRQTLSPGLYHYRISASQNINSYWPFLLVVSDYSILVKRSDEQVFAWVVNLPDGQPAAGYSLDLFAGNSNMLDSCVTDDDGTCTLNMTSKADAWVPVLVVHGEPGDDDFSLGSSAWQMGVNGNDFGFRTYKWSDEVTYLYTDRPIYRPGQTVYFRSVTRHEKDARYTLPDLKEIHVEVYGTYEEETGEVPLLETIPVSLSDYGSGTGSFVIPEDARAGYYSLRITEAEDIYLSFQVADYRKPEIDLQVKFSADEAVKGEDLRAEVSAEYYFGASASNVPLRWVLYSAGGYFELPFGYQTGMEPFPWQYHMRDYLMHAELGNWLFEGNAQTGDDGSVQIEIPYDDFKELIPADSLRRLTLEVTIQDNSELPISARDSLLYHPETFYIGVKAEQWSGKAGVPLGFAIQTADLQKDAASAIELSAVLKKIRWINQWNEVSGYRETKPEYSEVSSVDLTTDTDGQSRVEMTPDEPGMYLFEVSGGNAVTQLVVWVGGSGNVSWPDFSDQEVAITLDKEAYQAGETASLFIPNPFDKALALMTIERDDVISSKVMRVEGAELNLDLDIPEQFAPNVYVSITLIDTDSAAGYDFRQGYVNIPVDPQRLHMQVDLQASPALAEPGGDVLLTVLARDWQGKPVQGEFSLSLIDKAVLALAEPNAVDILKAFYDTQPLLVRSGFSLAGYAARSVSPGADGLGGGGGAETPVFLRQDFRDTAYWNGSVVTDPTGRAEVAVSLPDNVTTWVALARGISHESLVGEAQAEITVSRPLLISPITPRFAVIGDHMTLAAAVHNNTAGDLAVEVSLQAAGFSLDEYAKSIQKITVPGRSSYRVEWRGTVQDLDEMDLTFTALADEYRDAAVPELGSIPILHYSSPQTYAASGVLDEAGELVESISLPHTWQPTGGSLKVEMSPSLAASILSDMKALKNFDQAFTETIISILLPNLEMLDALRTFGMDDTDLQTELTSQIRKSLEMLPDLQGEDGGWGWMKGSDSDPYLSSYVLIGLTRAAEEDFSFDAEIMPKTQVYLAGAIQQPYRDMPQWELDRQVFLNYALLASGAQGLDSSLFLDYRDRLNPWSKALLALALSMQDPGDPNVSGLLDEVESLAGMTATGMYWDSVASERRNLDSTLFSTSAVIYSLAKLDPASSQLPAAVRYLAAHRKAWGGWNTCYESAWALRALIEVMKGTGELQANFDYSAAVNGTQMVSGQAKGLEQLTTVTGSVPVSGLLQDLPNALRIRRGEGEGRLHYRAYLQVDRPVEDIEPVEQGLFAERSYSLWGESCTSEACTLIDRYSLAESQSPVLVHITLTVPEEMFYVVVEDWLPAGAEVVNPSLLITQQGSGMSAETEMEPLNPDVSRRGSWFFGQPEIYAERVRWVAPWLPAGTYELTYRFTPYMAGEYHVLPVSAWQYYFPEVVGSSAGQIFTIDQGLQP